MPKSDKADHFLQQSKQGPYYIYRTCHHNSYQWSFRLFQHEKYHIVTMELYHPVKSSDEKLNICGTCHGHCSKNEIPCKAVYKNELTD